MSGLNEDHDLLIRIDTQLGQTRKDVNALAESNHDMQTAIIKLTDVATQLQNTQAELARAQAEITKSSSDFVLRMARFDTRVDNLETRLTDVETNGRENRKSRTQITVAIVTSVIAMLGSVICALIAGLA